MRRRVKAGGTVSSGEENLVGYSVRAFRLDYVYVITGIDLKSGAEPSVENDLVAVFCVVTVNLNIGNNDRLSGSLKREVMLTCGKVELERLNGITEPVTKEVCTPFGSFYTVGTDVVIFYILIPNVVSACTLGIL